MMQGNRLAKSTLPLLLVNPVMGSRLNGLGFIDRTHHRTDEEESEDRRERERKPNPRGGFVPHHGDAHQRSVRYHLTERRGKIEFVKASGREVRFVLEDEGVNEEINGLERQGCRNDGEGEEHNVGKDPDGVPPASCLGPSSRQGRPWKPP